MQKSILAVVLITSAWLAACSSEQNSSVTGPGVSLRRVTAAAVDPAKFVSIIDNPYLPLVPGVARTYRAETPDGVEITVDEATPDTKVILGVATTVVHNTVTLNNELIEETFEWYAQDKNGTVWYFGEDTRVYDHGQLATTFGSWEAGVNGANPGIIMLAKPHPGDQYVQEDAPGVAVDQARVVSLSKKAQVPYGTFNGCIETKDFTQLQHGVSEFKLYARGIGLISERDAAHNVTAELVSVE